MKKLLCVLMAALMLMVMVPVSSNAATDTTVKAVTTKSNGKPYYVMVNRSQNTVTVYTLDDNGYYSVPYKAFVCSTGREGHRTPLGTFKMGTNQYRWRLMVDGSYAQYACGIYKGIMFHSVCYHSRNAADLMSEEYDGLGDYASLGCVRLQTRDAKWIYDNCKPGTLVTIYDGDVPGALGKPTQDIANLSGSIVPNWDPTDPDLANPWWTYWNALEAQKAAAQGK